MSPKRRHVCRPPLSALDAGQQWIPHLQGNISMDTCVTDYISIPSATSMMQTSCAPFRWHMNYGHCKCQPDSALLPQSGQFRHLRHNAKSLQTTALFFTWAVVACSARQLYNLNQLFDSDFVSRPALISLRERETRDAPATTRAAKSASLSPPPGMRASGRPLHKALHATGCCAFASSPVRPCMWYPFR